MSERDKTRKAGRSTADIFDSVASHINPKKGPGVGGPQRVISLERATKETEIRLSINLDSDDNSQILIGLPFFEHMLKAMSFHGGFGLSIIAKGDVEVDPHHLVEDIGLVLGHALFNALEQYGAVKRYGWALIPMDDALSEVAIDVCKRPYLVYTADYPQTHCGSFDVSLAREFFQALANRAQINLHLSCRYGHNSHHMMESLFKALGKAISMAYAKADDSTKMSTKGVL